LFLVLKKLHNQPEVTASDLAKIINCSLQQAVNYNNIINSSDKLKNLIKTGKINSIDKAATVAKSSPDIQDLLINSCLNGASLKKLKQLTSTGLKSLELPIKSITQSSKAINLSKINITLNLQITRKIIELIINNSEYNLLSKNNFDLNNIAWDNSESVSNALKAAVSLLEDS
jgi:hypothetical protein